MIDHPSRAFGPSDIRGLRLNRIWRVEADLSYHNRWTRRDKPFHIALRTMAGEGRVFLRNGEETVCTPDTVLFIHEPDLATYFCADRQWKFWWFEFDPTGRRFFPLHHLIHLPHGVDSTEAFQAIFIKLRSSHRMIRCGATAEFQALVYRWGAQWDRSEWTSINERRVEKVIARMHRRLGERWSVADMAESVHLTPRMLNKIFHEVVGRSPKSVYDHIRMQEALDLLQGTQLSLDQLAHRLGFSGPSHFSKAFKAHFNHTPGAVRSGKMIKPPEAL